MRGTRDRRRPRRFDDLARRRRALLRRPRLSLERDDEWIAAWRRNLAEAGLEETAELIEGDARKTLELIDDVFDVVFLDVASRFYEELFQLAREKVEPGALVIADDVALH
ncbi:MAG TPA: class I SAM-dependent methyltransferase, partial [Gaiellaceae bacterium]